MKREWSRNINNDNSNNNKWGKKKQYSNKQTDIAPTGDEHNRIYRRDFIFAGW